MADITPGFCFICGRRLERRYPGCYLPEDPPEYIRMEAHLPPDQRIYGPEQTHPHGNPEDGPKEWRCPAGHPTVQEQVEQEIMSGGWVNPDEFLNAFQEGQRGCAEDPEISPEVMEAAKIINGYRNLRDEFWSSRREEAERLCEELARQSSPFPPHPDDTPETQRKMQQEHTVLRPGLQLANEEKDLDDLISAGEELEEAIADHNHVVIDGPRTTRAMVLSAKKGDR